jgi:hypothetical protein
VGRLVIVALVSGWFTWASRPPHLEGVWRACLVSYVDQGVACGLVTIDTLHVVKLRTDHSVHYFPLTARIPLKQLLGARTFLYGAILTDSAGSGLRFRLGTTDGTNLGSEDGGFAADLVLAGDSLVGTWSHRHRDGHTTGRLVLHRAEVK